MHVHIFIMQARRGTKSDIVIQMILEQVLVQRFKKKEMDEKITFNEDMSIFQREQVPLEE